MEVPTALTMFSGTLKPLPMTRKPWPATAIPFGNRPKAMADSAKGIDVRTSATLPSA